MNDLVRIAQATTGASAAVKVKITKPADGTAQVILVAPGMVLDLKDLAAQNVVMVHAGDRLVILFPDNSAVVLKGFYGTDGQPIAGLQIDLGRVDPLPAGQLASLLPISEDQNLLPASGPASSSGIGSSLYVAPVSPDALGDAGNALDLLTSEGLAATNNFSPLEDAGRPNTPAVIGGQITGTTTEDVVLSVSGIVTVADPDAGEAGVIEQPKTVGLYGSFSITADGTWTYTLDNALAEVQALGQGKSLTESFLVTSIDFTASQIVTVTIKGTNDVPVLGGDVTGTTVEDTTLSTSGTLTIADVDTGESSFIPQTDIQGQYGKFTVDAAGHWTFVLDNAAVQSLGAGTSVTDSFVVTSMDGSASQTVTVTIDGTNDVPVLGGVTTGTTKEDTTLTASGVLTISDVDSGEAHYVAQTGTAGQYGTFSVDADGNWTFALNNSSTAVQQLGAHGQLTESFTVWSLDLSASQTVTVTINGTNDVPVIGGVATGAVQEDTIYGINGVLTINDTDTGESFFASDVIAGTYGTFSVGADGAWFYILNNASVAVQSLGASSHPTETFTVWSVDGTASQTVTITVNGKNDLPTLYGVTSGSVTEDGTLNAGNNLYITDPDAGEAFYDPQTTNGTYGTFSIDANGHWTYTLNNNSTAVQSLPLGSNPTETFTVWSQDHSASLNITVQVRGANDVPTIGGVVAGTVTEDNVTAATGNLTIVDPDSGQSSFIARTNVAGTYGTFSINSAGAWTYTLNNSSSAVQNLGPDSHPTETFTVTSADGTATQTVTITVNGVNDAPSGANKTVTTLEDTAYTFATSDFGFTDIDGGTLQGVKITQIPGAGTLTLNGVAVTANQIVSASDIASGLLVFTPAQNGNGTGYANFKFAVQDDGGTANNGQDTDQTPNTITLNVTSVNDAPSGTDATIQAYEDTAYVLKASDFGFTDVDGNSLTGVKITQLPGAGTLTLNGVAVTVGQTISLGNITTGLLKFTAASNASGSNYASIQFAVQDNGGTANGGADIDPTPNTLTFNVGAVNDAPSGADKTVTTLEDTAYTFQTSDFGFSDTDGGTFQGLKITQLPGAGSLTLNGVAVALNQVISATDIASGLLVFTPAANGNGGAYATFRFAVQDNGGTANGGQEFDTSPNMITVSVTSVNDAPVLDATKSPAMSITEDAATPTNGTPGTKVSDIVDRVIDGVGNDNITDVDSFIAGMAIVGVNTAAGTLYYSPNNGASWIAVGAVSATSSLLLRPEYLLYFKPAANYSGTVEDAITFRAWDVSSGTPTTYVNTSVNGGSTAFSAATDTISVTVTGVNDAPVAQAKSASVSEDGTLTGQSVTATDADNDPLTYAIVGATPAGLTFNPDGTWAYAPPASYQSLDSGENATVTFQYKANDGTVDSNTATVTITVQGANDAPVAQGGSASVSEDGTLTGQTITATDVDVETLSYAIVGATPPGLTFNTTNGTWSYVPPAAMQGLDDGESQVVTFQYKANDGTVDSNVATVTITVNGANDAPVAANRSASVSEDGTLNGPAAFATDADIETLTYAIYGATPPGLTFNADGTWTYTPPASFQAMDDNETQQVTFQYKANDGTTDSNAATVIITVEGANDAPVAQSSTASVSEDGSLTGQQVVASDVDVESLSYAVVGTAPAGLTFNANGTWSYTPPASYQSLTAGQTADVTFQYVANDGTVNSAPATVTITVIGANETPVAQDASASVSEDGTLTGQHVTASDGSATPLTYTTVGTVPAGLTFNPDGTWSYAPPASYQSLDDGEHATVSFQYKAGNGLEDSNVATVTITIDGANDKPVAQDDATSVSEDGAIVGRSFIATDVDVETLTYAIVGATPAGLTLNANGTWNYTPPAATYQSLDDGETATVTFQFKANDGTVDSDPKTVTITVTGANDAPVAQGGTVSVSEDGALTGQQVAATDVDIESLTYALTSAPLSGLTFNTDGTWSYTPPASYQSLAQGQSTTVSFTYQAFDGTAYSNVATQTIVIQGANDAPIARPDSGTMVENQGPTEFNVIGNDTLDPDSGAPNTLTAGLVTIYGGSGYGLDANDVSVTATATGLNVSLIGTDWDKLSRGQTMTMTIGYTLVGDPGPERQQPAHPDGDGRQRRAGTRRVEDSNSHRLTKTRRHRPADPAR